MFESARRRIMRCIAGFPCHLSPADLARERKELFGACLICGGELNGHASWRLASVFLEDESDTPSRLADLVAKEKWAEASAFQEWAGDRDEREYYVVRCPVEKSLALISVISVAEMWSNDHIEATELLSEEASQALSALVGDRWDGF